jgi:hypothetical protein
MRPKTASTLVALVLVALTGCASRLDPGALAQGQSPVQLQNRLLLTPANGGQHIAPTDLRAGDLVLSNTAGLVSAGIRLLTLAPVSHAALYLGEGQIAEAVGSGVRIRPIGAFMVDESTIVAFRHPDLRPEHAQAIRSFAQAQEGKKYNTLGIVLQAPFTLQRQYCELPILPGLVRDFCLRGLAAVQLGAARNDRFFCSQFVLAAYQQAQLRLTTVDPLLVNPADLLHMREGDVPSVRTQQALQYVGHLKSEPAQSKPTLAAAADD